MSNSNVCFRGIGINLPEIRISPRKKKKNTPLNLEAFLSSAYGLLLEMQKKKSAFYRQGFVGFCMHSKKRLLSFNRSKSKWPKLHIEEILEVVLAQIAFAKIELVESALRSTAAWFFVMVLTQAKYKSIQKVAATSFFV